VSHPQDPIPRPETVGQTEWASDSLISIADIRNLFKLGRTAAYELTHRPDFPEPIPISPRCYRWWASEVDAFAAALRRKRSAESRRARRTQRPANSPTHHPSTPPRRITGTVRAARGRKEAP
jgi:predicted DNA-binding transcriptional regulator AlpA